ncbi:MAG TPA: succinyl-diaminopimelate desuccinylase [Stellaceae bacterium]|nr:succinyl-diaminopimelate desuccinylase [Stellaceae bacterium]
MAGLDALSATQELIRAPSVTPADAGAIPALKRMLERLGFACETVEFAEPGTTPILNLYARRGRGGRNFCFAGHTDVVPPGDVSRWSVDPFGAVVKDGVLYGRGAVDMKGAIGAMVAACDAFLGARPQETGGSISFLITGDEEADAINGTRKLLDWVAAKGERIDACVVGEPTSAETFGDMIKIGRRGSLNGYLTVHGVQGHTAYPHLADNAAHRLVAMLSALTTTPLDRGNPHFPASSLAVSTIDIGNKTTNVIPGEARAVFNVRFNDEWSGATVERWLKRRLDEAGGRYDLQVRVSGESFLVPPGEVSTILSQAIGRVTGQKPELSTTGGTSDARFIHRFCPCAEFGLLNLTAHKVDESVPVADLAALAAIYRTALELFFAVG